MKIKYTPASPKHPLEEHVRNDIAQTLIAAGFAEPVPLPFRGSPGWVEARLQESRELSGGKAGPHDVVPLGVVGVVWEVIELPRTGKPAILRKENCEVVRFENAKQAKAHGCPQSVLEQYTAVAEAPVGQGAVVLAAAKAAQVTQEEAEKVSRWRVLTARA